MAGTEVEALRAFREGLYGCFGRRDALLTPGPCVSLPHLSLAPGHRHGWGSVYAALRRGHFHLEALRALLRRQPLPPGPPLYAVDVSVWPRADAATSPERGYQYHSPRRRRSWTIPDPRSGHSGQGCGSGRRGAGRPGRTRTQGLRRRPPSL